MTVGEIGAYVRTFNKRCREDAQRQSVIAYHQAGLIARFVLDAKDPPDAWDVFPFWTEEEVDELDTQRALSELKKTIYGSAPVNAKEG